MAKEDAKMKRFFYLILVVVLVFGVFCGRSDAIPVCGSMYHGMDPGTWTTMPEVATVYIKTASGEFWVFDFEKSGKDPKSWYVARLGDFSRLGDFVSLAPSDIKEEKWWTWENMKSFVRGNMPKEEVASFVEAVEDYLKRKGWLDE